MYQTQQPANPNPNPNPYSYSSYPPQSTILTETFLHNANLGTYPTYPIPNVPFEGQTNAYYTDPNAASATWVTTQAAPVLYESGSLVSTSSNSTGNSCWTNQPSLNDVKKSIPAQNKVIQPMRCVVCNIDCNSKEVFEKHVSGKKHQRNVQIQHNPTSTTLQNLSGSINNIHNPNQELVIKKQKLLDGGAAADSVVVCAICNVACNGQEVFRKHLYGKKHAAQAGLMSLNGGQYFTGIKAKNNSFWSRGPQKTKIVQSAWCDICKINCNSNEVYVKHLQGKKHQKNLEKTQNNSCATATVAAPTDSIIGPIEKTVANKSKGVDVQKLPKRLAQSQSTFEDLERKKQKVMEGGVAASTVRVCTICNVVCNSQTVFHYHLTGQKHAAMVKKQAEEGPQEIIGAT